MYYTIGEVAALLNENSSTLRFWEKEFPCLRPVKNSRGDRRYVESDLELLRHIQRLTRKEGYTIEGAREQIRRERRQSDPTPELQADSVREQVIASLCQVREKLVKLSESF